MTLGIRLTFSSNMSATECFKLIIMWCWSLQDLIVCTVFPWTAGQSHASLSRATLGWQVLKIWTHIGHNQMWFMLCKGPVRTKRLRRQFFSYQLWLGVRMYSDARHLEQRQSDDADTLNCPFLCKVLNIWSKKKT